MDFRLYDNALGRFFGIDLLADQFTGQSPYHFAYNSPILFGDPSGLDPTDPPTGGGSSWGPEIIINVGGGGFTTPIPYFGNLYDQVGFYDLSNPFEDREILPEIIIDPKPKEQETKNDSGGNVNWERIQFGFETISEVGSWMEIAGYAGAPFTDGATLALSAVGEVFQNVGVGGSAAIDIFVYDRYEKATLDVSFHLLTSGLGHAIPGARESYRYAAGNIILSQF